MAFIRPEISSAVWRWREALVGGIMSALGMYWAIAATGVLSAAGISLAVAGSLLVFAGIQRARFRRGRGGPGLVQVDERQVVYYGPEDGGVVSIDSLDMVELEPRTPPSGAWLLREPGGQPLEIPTNAENAEALFDVFAALEGIETEHMLAQLSANPRRRVTIWQAPRPALH